MEGEENLSEVFLVFPMNTKGNKCERLLELIIKKQKELNGKSAICKGGLTPSSQLFSIFRKMEIKGKILRIFIDCNKGMIDPDFDLNSLTILINLNGITFQTKNGNFTKEVTIFFKSSSCRIKV